MALLARANFSLNATLTKALDLSIVTDPLAIAKTFAMSDAGPFPADNLWHDSKSLADSANETLDLNTDLTDGVGNTFSCAGDIKVLYIRNTSANNTLIIGGAATNQVPLFADDTTDKFVLQPGGIFIVMFPIAAGLTIGANDNLKLENGSEVSEALVYEIAIIGNSS